MKSAIGIWSALCAIPLAIAFVALPAWDTTTEGFEIVSGAAAFLLISVLVSAIWIVGLGVLVLGTAVRRRLCRGR